jgi:hypothetical protein
MRAAVAFAVLLAGAVLVAVLLVAAVSPARAAAPPPPPPRPETPAQIEACLGDLRCAATWLIGKIDNPQVHGSPRTGHMFAASWRSWHRYLRRIGQPVNGPAEAPAELVPPDPDRVPFGVRSLGGAPEQRDPLDKPFRAKPCRQDLDCAARWLAYNDKGQFLVLDQPREGEEAAAARAMWRCEPPEARIMYDSEAMRRWDREPLPWPTTTPAGC